MHCSWVESLTKRKQLVKVVKYLAHITLILSYYKI